MVRRKVDQNCVGGPCRSGENCGGQNHSNRHREHLLRHARPSMDQELIWWSHQASCRVTIHRSAMVLERHREGQGQTESTVANLSFFSVSRGFSVKKAVSRLGFHEPRIRPRCVCLTGLTTQQRDAYFANPRMITIPGPLTPGNDPEIVPLKTNPSPDA